MGLIKKEVFVCVDCESTGLDVENDRVIEIGAVRFTEDEVLGQFETLIDPERPIPEETQKIHHISDEMVAGQPKEKEVVQDVLDFIGRSTLIGHGILFDLQLIDNAAKRSGLSSALAGRPYIDTLRLARHYGQCPKNSLTGLRQHFGLPAETAHRAMDDAIVNMKVFFKLIHGMQTTEQIYKTLSKPIRMHKVPLGKYKGRPFKEVPTNWLNWAAHQKFDQDLLFSIKEELKKRRKGSEFRQAGNPFTEL